MIQPAITHIFALEQHPGAYETWPAKSRLIADGLTLDVAVPGYQLLHQFEIPDGYFLLTDFDCPYEEATSFILVSRDMKMLAKRSIVVMYRSFLLDALEWIDPRQLTATFHDQDRWRLQIKKPLLPLVPWRISANRI
jgi:hypothetical protein